MRNTVGKGVHPQTSASVSVRSYTSGSQRKADSRRGFLCILRDSSKSRYPQKRLLCKMVGEPLGFDGRLTGFFKSMSSCHTEWLFIHLFRRPSPLYWTSPVIIATAQVRSCEGSHFPPVIPPIFWEVGDFPFPSFNCPLWKARLKRPAVGVCMPRFRFLQNDRKGFCLWISSDNSLPPLVSMRNTGLQSVSWWLFFTETLLHYIFLMQNLQWLSTRMLQLKASTFSILLF